MSGYELTYIHHDCFMLETEMAVIIFDYWKDPLSAGKDKDFPPLVDEIPRQKHAYILVSHHHKDHFSRRIFLWSQKIPRITYIISKDVFKAVKYMFRKESQYQGYKPPLERVIVLSPGDYYQDDIIGIKAFRSTDIGNSYAVSVSGLKVFHAGDLNAWLWLDESTEEEIDEARHTYIDIVTGISRDYPAFDLVMFPVDSRLGREYWWGASYFVNKIKTSLFVPMHFELVLSQEEKEQRRMDAAAFKLFARRDFGSYLQLASTRSRYISVGDQL